MESTNAVTVDDVEFASSTKLKNSDIWVANHESVAHISVFFSCLAYCKKYASSVISARRNHVYVRNGVALC